MVVPNMHNPIKDKLLILMSDKDVLERRIREYGDILQSNCNVGMDGPLLDAEQFPRNDIDVYAVRNARHQIICLQNDYNKLVKEIEGLLHVLHSDNAEQSHELSRKAENMQLHDVVELPLSNLPLDAFAKIALLAPNSPAANAGLRIGDLLLEFGSVNSRNFKNNLNVIQNVVQNMQNRVVNIKVKRDADIVNLSLMPKVWTGRGLLGCTIHMLDAVER